MSAKVLFYDIETSPNLGYVWAKWQQDVIKFEREWSILCYSYQWAHEKTVRVVSLPDFSLYKRQPLDDTALIKSLWDLHNEADVVVAHNGDKFDNRKSNARFLVKGMTPPSPYRTVDTLKVLRKHFYFNSNKLDDACQLLGIGEKVKHPGFEMWHKCLLGDEKAWNTMRRYAKRDVVLLKKLYHKLLPWISNHPNMGLYEDDMEIPRCPNCGSKNLIRRGMIGSSGKMKYSCKNCGKFSRARFKERGLKLPPVV